MQLFDVYPLYDVEPIRAEGSWLWDSQGTKYLDLYGGHAVISVGHTHPLYVQRINEQLGKLAFYSNSVQNSIQENLAKKLGKLSNYEDYSLFLCNSGAEANENALKLASFHNGRKKVISFQKSFHGRTEGAVVITDNPKIIAPINEKKEIVFLPLNDEQALENELKTGDVCAVIVEGIQGVAGIFVPTDAFLQAARRLCSQYGTVLILDEVQSGYGRSGRFFAHQYSGIKADIITVAKGMGNGFPIGGVLISAQFKAVHGMLGTTFGGNHLGCAAALAVLEIIEKENLVENAEKMGHYLIQKLASIKGVKEVRGSGLMLGIHLEQEYASVRNRLLKEHCIFTGSSSEKHTLRLLPALNVSYQELDLFLEKLAIVLAK